MESSGYRGKNRHSEFLSAARTIAGKVSRIDGVVGILATGGIGRGFCDDFSDLDLTIYAEDSKVRKLRKYLAVGFLRHKNIALDTPVESYQRACRAPSPSAYWSQEARWDRQNSLILHDTGGRVKKMLTEKIVFPEGERRGLFKTHAWGAEEHLRYFFPLWAKRGNVVNLADTVRRGAEHLILWVYAKNGKFRPYLPKWLFYYLENNLIPESRYFATIRKAYCEPIKTMRQASGVQSALLDVCGKVGMEFECESIEEVFEREEKNWEKASEKTRHYLGW